MNNSSYTKLKTAISDVIIHGKDVNSVFGGFGITEEHKGAYITFVDDNKVVYQNGILKPPSQELSETIKSICTKKDEVKETAKLIVYVVKDVIYLKDKTDWDASKDGVFFQWGNRFRGMLLPHEMQSVSGNKVKILDKLCSQRIGIPSSCWAYPEGLLYRILLDIYK